MSCRTKPITASALACVLTLSSCLAACRSSRAPARADAPAPSIATDEELRGDAEVESRLEVLDPRMLPTGKGRTLSFSLRNKSSSREDFLLAIEWYDHAGRPVATARRAWSPVTLEPGAIRDVEITVPVPEAESWRWHAIRHDTVR